MRGHEANGFLRTGSPPSSASLPCDFEAPAAGSAAAAATNPRRVTFFMRASAPDDTARAARRATIPARLYSGATR